MSTDVKQLDRVVIRIAGDSGDGMQLTGDRFTQETANFGNDLSTLPNFPGRDPRACRHAGRGVVLPAALRRPRHPDPGRPARRAGGDEPGRAEGQPRRPAARAPRSSSTPTTSPSGRWPGSAGRPTRSPTARLDALHRARDRPDPAHPGRAGRHSICPARTPAACKNMYALGLLSWMYSRPTEGTLDFLREKFAKQARHRRGQHRRVPGRLELRRDDRGLRRLLRGQAGRAAAPAPTATSPATWPWPTA